MNAIKGEKSMWKVQTKFRSQNSITRDPWTLFYAACIHLDRREYIVMKPQWFIYRPSLWSLRRALLGKPNLYKMWVKLDDFIHRFVSKKKFASSLDKWKQWAYDNKDI